MGHREKEDRHPEAEDRGLGLALPCSPQKYPLCPHLDLGPSGSRTETINISCYAAWSAATGKTVEVPRRKDPSSPLLCGAFTWLHLSCCGDSRAPGQAGHVDRARGHPDSGLRAQEPKHAALQGALSTERATSSCPAPSAQPSAQQL